MDAKAIQEAIKERLSHREDLDVTAVTIGGESGEVIDVEFNYKMRTQVNISEALQALASPAVVGELIAGRVEVDADDVRDFLTGDLD